MYKFHGIRKTLTRIRACADRQTEIIITFKLCLKVLKKKDQFNGLKGRPVQEF